MIKNIWLKTKNTAESSERQKTNFPTEIVEIADLHKPALIKIMTTHVKYDFVALLKRTPQSA